MVPGRTAGVPEWLDLIKQEFESLSHEAMVTKAQRDECEHKSTYKFKNDPFVMALLDMPLFLLVPKQPNRLWDVMNVVTVIKSAQPAQQTNQSRDSWQ